jgi:hypothetical protein
MAECNKGCSEPEKKMHCPFRMSSGNFITDYRPRCAINNEINLLLKNDNKIVSSYEARMYLQQNGLKEIERQQNVSISKFSDIGCFPCNKSLTDTGTMHPERYVVRCNKTSCERFEINMMGLGDGRSSI